jgi:hypothetical protein
MIRILVLTLLLKKLSCNIHHHHHHHHHRASRIRPLDLFQFTVYFLKLMNPFGELVELFRLGIGPTYGFYLHRNHNRAKRGQTSMPRVGFETTIPVFERPKTVRTSHCLALGTGNIYTNLFFNFTAYVPFFNKGESVIVIKS